MLQAVTDADVSNDAFPYMTARYLNVGEVGPVWAQRISYAGELGWELYGQFAMGDRAWDLLWEAGREHGIVAAGSGAFDSLRLEKGYRLWGQDIHTGARPVRGRARLRGAHGQGRLPGTGGAGGDPGRRGHAHKLACMTLDDPATVVMGKEPIWSRRPGRGLRDVGGLRVLDGPRDRLRLPARWTSPGRARRSRSSTSANDIAATVAADPLWDPKGERLKG